MIRMYKSIYKISHLYFDPLNQKILQQYKETSNGPYNLPLKCIYSQYKPTLYNKIFLDRDLVNRFQSVIEFIDQCGKNKSQQNDSEFSDIQQTLRNRIHSFIKSRPQQITVHQCDVGKAHFLEQRKIYGVFYHRKLNLAKSCYSTQFVQKTGDLKYRLKGKLTRMQDMKQLQKNMNLYQQQGFSSIYKDTYEGFKKSQFIIRSLVKVIADIKIEIKVPEFEESIRIGYQGPTEHILQYQSYNVPYQQEQYAITDIDFFMEGNYHFLKDRN